MSAARSLRVGEDFTVISLTSRMKFLLCSSIVNQDWTDVIAEKAKVEPRFAKVTQEVCPKSGQLIESLLQTKKFPLG